MKKPVNDHRTRITQLMIRKAFTELMREKPIESITISELCKRASINRSTFYNHYLDLYDLRSQIVENLKEEFYQALKSLLTSDSVDQTPVKITAKLFECIQNNSDMCQVILGRYGDDQFLAEFVQSGREFVMESYRIYFENASQKQIDYFYTFVSCGIIGLLRKWLSDGLETPADEIAHMAESMMLQGAGCLYNKCDPDQPAGWKNSQKPSIFYADN